MFPLKLLADTSGPVIQFGNIFYFIPIIVLILVFIFSNHLCHKKGEKFAKRFIYALLWGNFALHFIKNLFPGYINEMPYMLSHSSFENLCASLIILAPFIVIWGNSHFKDYFFYIGIISGVGSFLYPSGIMNKPLSNPEQLIETFRFYTCHLCLALSGFLLVSQNFHKLNYHRLWCIPCIFCLMSGIVFLNSIFLWAVGAWTQWYGDIGNVDNWKTFLSNREMINNNGSQIGPPLVQTKDSQWGTVELIKWHQFMIPYLQTYHMDVYNAKLGTYVDTICYVPALWAFIPVAILTPPVGFAMSFRWEHNHMKLDLITVKQYFKMRRSSRSSFN